jgi:hypothetical protein
MQEKVERTAEIMALVAQGWTRKKIGEHYGISAASVTEVVQRERSKHPIDKQDAIATQVEILDGLIEAAMEIVHMRPAPVTAGKDGDVVRDPEDQAVVRDFSARMSAMATVKSLQERKAKLLGLDSAVKTELTGGITYRIESIDPADIG